MQFSNKKVSSDLLTGMRAIPGLPADKLEELSQRLTRYLAELYKWNKAYNLTAVRDPQEMVTRHILDSLMANTLLRGSDILDVGTGAGLPGIPLAMVYPNKRLTLLDTNGKKVRFVRHAAGALALSNVEPVQSRVEEFAPERPFTTIISRAFASLADFIAGSQHLLAPEGCLLAMKGKLLDEEIAALPPGWIISKTVAVEVPGLIGDRHLLVIEKS
jgi:16S rRNA (guanine527-N7)-methyltransferase